MDSAPDEKFDTQPAHRGAARSPVRPYLTATIPPSQHISHMSHLLYTVRQVRRFAPENEAMYAAAAAPADLSRHRADVPILSCSRATAVLVREVERQGSEGRGWTVNPGPAMVEVIHAADGTTTERSG